MKMAVAMAVKVIVVSSKMKGVFGETASYRKPPKSNAPEPRMQSTKFEKAITFPLYSFGVRSACMEGYAVKTNALQTAENATKKYSPVGLPCKNNIIPRAPNMDEKISGFFLPKVSTNLPTGSSRE